MYSLTPSLLHSTYHYLSYYYLPWPITCHIPAIHCYFCVEVLWLCNFSFMNSDGPRTVSCGTPQWRLNSWETCPSSRVLRLRREFDEADHFPLIFSWFMVSHAEDRSYNVLVVESKEHRRIMYLEEKNYVQKIICCLLKDLSPVTMLCIVIYGFGYGKTKACLESRPRKWVLKLVKYNLVVSITFFFLFQWKTPSLRTNVKILHKRIYNVL